jgi:hypothetical protein
MKMSNWKERALAATDGTKTGAILRAVLGCNTEHATRRFGDSAVITSDGFVLADFVDQHGEYHMGAFVGSYDDMLRNFGNLAAHCNLVGNDHKELLDAVDAWCGKRRSLQ